MLNLWTVKLNNMKKTQRQCMQKTTMRVKTLMATDFSHVRAL